GRGAGAIWSVVCDSPLDVGPHDRSRQPVCGRVEARWFVRDRQCTGGGAAGISRLAREGQVYSRSARQRSGREMEKRADEGHAAARRTEGVGRRDRRRSVWKVEVGGQMSEVSIRNIAWFV